MGVMRNNNKKEEVSLLFELRLLLYDDGVVSAHDADVSGL